MMKTTFKNFILSFAVLYATFSLAQESTANYDISLTTIWNSADHTSVPGNAHWSPLVGATHSTANEFVSLGTLATTGIKNVAETGNNTVIRSEINAAIAGNQADQLLEDGFAPFAGNGSVAGFSNITVSANYPLITLVSMVAPSPDWFIALNSLDLRSGNPAVNNGWKDTFTVDVFAYDSGTDDGSNYSSDNSPNTPVPVAMASGAPINGNRMATITFTYNSSTLSIDDITSLENIKVYPNPATNVINITKTLDNRLESAELYNVLGNRVNLVTSSNETSMSINTSSLLSGVYILKLNGINGESSSRKVIIQ